MNEEQKPVPQPNLEEIAAPLAATTDRFIEYISTDSWPWKGSTPEQKRKALRDILTTATEPLRESLQGHKNREQAWTDRYSEIVAENTDLRSQVAKLTKERDDANTRELELSRQFNEMKHLRDRLQEQVRELENVLVSIEEYWNGNEASAVDAAEEMRERARAARGEKEGK